MNNNTKNQTALEKNFVNNQPNLQDNFLSDSQPHSAKSLVDNQEYSQNSQPHSVNSLADNQEYSQNSQPHFTPPFSDAKENSNTQENPNKTLKSQYSPASIANYMLRQSFLENIPLTPMKLIKLVYISYGWHLAFIGNKLFDEKIQAWKYGPVIPSLYHEFKRFGKDIIDDYSHDFDEKTGELTMPKTVDDFSRTAKVLYIVWETYKNYSGFELSEITHKPNSPWDKAIKEKGLLAEIDDEEIRLISKSAIAKNHEKLKNSKVRN
jgi:uncharacterized phage-associated protein